MKFVKKPNKSFFLAVQSLLSLLIAFSVNLLVSANFKMLLYEGAYGFTYLRLFVHYFMGLLLVLFLLALFNIWLAKPPLVKTYLVVSLVFYIGLNFLNPDRFIARYNVDLFLNNGKIDVLYLQSLSYDAVPELVKLSRLDPAEAGKLKDYLLTLKGELAKRSPWQSFNYSRYRAASALKDL